MTANLNVLLRYFVLRLTLFIPGFLVLPGATSPGKKKKKKKKQVSLSLITTERFFLVDMVQKKRPSIYQKSQEFRLGEVDKNRVFLQP